MNHDDRISAQHLCMAWQVRVWWCFTQNQMPHYSRIRWLNGVKKRRWGARLGRRAICEPPVLEIGVWTVVVEWTPGWSLAGGCRGNIAKDGPPQKPQKLIAKKTSHKAKVED